MAIIQLYKFCNVSLLQSSQSFSFRFLYSQVNPFLSCQVPSFPTSSSTILNFFLSSSHSSIPNFLDNRVSPFPFVLPIVLSFPSSPNSHFHSHYQVPSHSSIPKLLYCKYLDSRIRMTVSHSRSIQVVWSALS